MYTGRHPTIKDDQKIVVPNMFVIDKASNAIPSGEEIKFVYYAWVAYCSMTKENSRKKQP